jgi:hypothetical protein
MLVASLFSLEWLGFIQYGVYGSPPFAAGGNRSYLEFWAVTGGRRYPGYFTPVTLEYILIDICGFLQLRPFMPGA